VTPLSLVNTKREIAESGVRWLCKSAAVQIAVEYRQSGRWLLAIDGFMGSGKTTLAQLLSEQLRGGVLSLDETDRLVTH
jgi:adenylylsulfate kinase-like enzyme